MEVNTHMKTFFLHTLVLALLLVSTAIEASDNISLVKGTVGAVGVVLDENGNPILAEYNASGNFVRDINIPDDTDINDLSIYSAKAYRSIYEIAQDIWENNPGSRIMSKSQYESGSFVTHTRTPQAIVKPSIIDPDTKSVLIIGEPQMLVPNPPYEGFILQEFPVDLSAGAGRLLEESVVSLLINKEGVIVHKTTNDIAYKIDTFEREGENRIKDDEGYYIPIFPLPHTGVMAGDIDALPMGGALTDDKGRYSMIFGIPACPGFAYEVKVPVMAKMPVHNFNPKSDGSSYNTALTWAWGSCSGYGDASIGASLSAISAQQNAQSIIATQAKPSTNLNIWFSTMQLAALATFSEVEQGTFVYPAAELGSNTIYQADEAAINPLTAPGDYHFDLDGDGETDIVQINPQDNSKIDIYLGDNIPRNDDGTVNPPDLTRLVDYEQLYQLKHQGLLKTISKTDLEDTDIYIYRNSTNQLIGQMEGLVERDSLEEDDVLLSGNNSNSPRLYKGVHEDETIATFGFSTLLRGAASFDITSGLEITDSSDRRPWLPAGESSAASFTNDRKPDFLRPGEIIKIIAINRATGYIGSVEARLFENYVQLETPIEMLPPNLKVIATRTYEDMVGVTQGVEHKNQLIGSEGAGLTSDKFVKIQTTWLDQDGSPLPDDLPGYTGRVAISTGSATEADAANNFAIKPGYLTQVIRLNNASELETEHFYVQVIGENFNGTPNFESPGAGPGKLQTRPKKYTPVKVPVYNELTTLVSQQALNKARKEGVANLPDEVQPVYHWVYRPEMQFSVYDFQNQQLQLTHVDDTVHLIDLTNNTVDKNLLSLLLADDVDMTELLYDLTGPDNEALLAFGPNRQLILSLGVEEVLAQITPGGSVVFENPKNLNQLTSEDLLSIRLYQNSDSFNVLWQYQFYSIGGKVDNNRDGILNFDTAQQVAQPEQGQNPEISDDTSETLPLRFWVNNDYDVVNDSGTVSTVTRCPQEIGEEAKCEQWDETEADSGSNTDSGDNFEIIESERDLEDFQPLIVKLPLSLDERGYPLLPEGAKFVFRAKNININLFRGAWKEGTDYLTNETVMQDQVKPSFDVDSDGAQERMYMFNLGTNRSEKLMDQADIEDYFGKNRIGRFIIESYAGSPRSCVQNPKDCYLELALEKGGEVLGQHRIYMQFYEVKEFYDHYTVGTGYSGENRLYPGYVDQHANSIPFQNINKDKDQDYENEYIMFVHGWRMKNPERVSFGETAFKRLYWSGYKGRFGLFSWPTGWFDKPAHLYGAAELSKLIGNEQNYGNSEVIARASGGLLSGLLADLRNEGKKVHIFAHSMGNVVVSEALRDANGVQLVDHYIASQAAEVGSAYSPYEYFINHKLKGGVSTQAGCIASNFDFFGTLGPEESWRCYDDEYRPLPSEYDMPPNYYTYDIPALHGATRPRLEAQVAMSEAWGAYYYHGISYATGSNGGNVSNSNIINFHNTRDRALVGWEFNQLSKPDYLGGPTWRYDWNWDCPYGTLDCAVDLYPNYENGDKVSDIYQSDTLLTSPISYNWTSSIPIDTDSAKILAHIIPARTHALGQRATMEGASEIGAHVNLNGLQGFGASNQGHSAQFYSNYFSRMDYWDAVLTNFNFVTE